MSTMVAAGNGWNPEANKYKCCCNCCHVKQGAMAIGVISLVFSILGAANQLRSIGAIGEAGGSAWPFYLMISTSLIDTVITIVTCVLLILGLNKERPGWLLPWLIWQGIKLVFCLVVIIGVIIAGVVGSVALTSFLRSQVNAAAARGESDLEGLTNEELSQGLAVGVSVLVGVVAVGFLICLLVGIWFFLVVLAAKRYLTDLAAFGGGSATATYAASYQPQYGQAQYGQTAAAYPPAYPAAYPSKQ